VDDFGFLNFFWAYSMVGNSPEEGHTTRINAPIVAVSLDLRTATGAPRKTPNGGPLYSDATKYVQPVLKSPVFSNYAYSSSEDPTQFTDAIQRAEFFKSADGDWHTLLAPSVKTPRVMILNQDPHCGDTNPKTQHCNYRFALNPDGSCCRYVLIDAGVFGNALFPAFPVTPDTPVGAAELSGEVTTKDLSTFLFPNAFLFDSQGCCILGYHTYDFEPGDASNGNRLRAYVLNYSSWISPGLFGSAFTDITALSHEVAETLNDPFVHNSTPWWLAPNGNCQNNLETGDVIEGLPKATYPITLNGFTYHPQNEALLQYFEFQQHSDALDHAYSYPDETVLTGPSAFQNPGCQ